MSLIDCSKNNENYFVIKVDDAVVEDYDGLERPCWRCVEKECPFPGCSENAWNRVKKNLWSVESSDSVKSYLKQHAMESALHGKNKEHPMPEDRIDAILQDVDIEESIDTFNDRMSYKEHMKDTRERNSKRKRDEEDAERWRSEGGSSSWQCESSDSKALLESIATLSQNVATLAAAKTAGAEPPLMPVTKALMQGPTSSELNSVPHYIASAIRSAEELDNGATLRCNEKIVGVPFSTLMLCKESTTRSKEACKQALASMLVPINQLRVELGVLSNTEAVLDQIIGAAKNS
jgi:hypothetical protein